MSVNKVILIGHLGKDPEIRSTNDGREVANFSVATTEKWKDANGERQEKTEWHKVVVFNTGVIPFVKQYAKKGSKVYIEGALQTRKWQDQNGNDRYSTDVVLNAYGSTFQMLDKKEDNQQVSEYSANKANGYMPESDFQLDDEVPF